MTDDSRHQSDATPPHTSLKLGYHGTSMIDSGKDTAQIRLFADMHRPEVNFCAKIKDPIAFREAAAALYAIVSSDYRYVPKDRTAYLAYMRLRRESANLNVMEAQQAYFNWLARNDPTAFLILDPVISVHPDQVSFEVFSRDEGALATLSVDIKAFETNHAPNYGTTNIDFSRRLYQGILKMRSYTPTELKIDSTRVEFNSGDTNILEKKINVPDSWLRGFLQVQSAGTLPHDTLTLAPIDLYNVLRHLRLHKDIKRKPRALRFELLPGERPRLVIEPWEKVIETQGEIFKNNRSKVVRIWGRRRLMLLSRFLPFVKKIHLHILGSGLPSFWVLKGDQITLTLALTGFTSANWSRALGFDLLLPRRAELTEELQTVRHYLNTVWFDTFDNISKATEINGAALQKVLQSGCQQAMFAYDINKSVYRLRPLVNDPINVRRLEFRNQFERKAHDLMGRKGAVSVESENRIYGTGIELVGKVIVRQDKRDYRPFLIIDDDGQVKKAQCTCTFFRKQGVKKGPCPHLIALRLAYALKMEKQLKEGNRSKSIIMETRTYCKRNNGKENICQITLNKERLKIRWGINGGELRVSNLHFNTIDEARNAFSDQITRLTQKGYLDTTTGIL